MARSHRFLLLAPLALAGLPGTASAAASYDSCAGFINSLPATISTQGTWCLNKDLNTALASGAAITIATNNVTIDCNGFKLGGLLAGVGTTTIGIHAAARQNTTVRDCAVRGFLQGIRLEGDGHAVEGNRLDGNTFVGVFVSGDGGYVRDNRVFDTGGSTVPMSMAIPFVGIQVEAAVEVLDNIVSGVVATPGRPASGIVATDGPLGGSRGGATIARNRIRDVVTDSGIAVGISALSGVHQPTSDYSYEAGALTWFAAEQACVLGGGHLAGIGNANENLIVQGLVFGNGPAWLGGTDADAEGAFVWVNGEPFSFQNWALGQPDNDADSSGNADHMAMQDNGTWLDTDGVSISFVTGSVCEVPKPPIRMTLRDNLLMGGSPGDYGTLCQDVDARRMGNVVSAYDTANLGCADGGSNIIQP